MKKTFEQLVEELMEDENAIQRIERFKPDSYLVCTQNLYEIAHSKNITNIRDFLSNFKNKKYVFTKGEKYKIGILKNTILTVHSIMNDGSGSNKIGSYFFSVIGQYQTTYTTHLDINDYFILESEWLGLQRDDKINEILKEK